MDDLGSSIVAYVTLRCHNETRELTLITALLLCIITFLQPFTIAVLTPVYCHCFSTLNYYFSTSLLHYSILSPH